MSESRGCSSGWGVCTFHSSGGQCLHPDRASEGRGCNADLRLQKMLRPFSWVRERQQTCLQRCAQVKDLLQQVAELQQVVRRRLHNIREAEELDSWFQMQCAVDPQPTAKQPKTPSPVHTEGRGDSTAEWKLATARNSRRKRFPLKPEMPLQNRSAD